MRERLRRILVHPYFAPSAIVVGVLLLTGSIDAGYMADDYMHNTMIRGAPELGWGKISPWDLYSLSPEDAEFRRKMIEKGVSPWWCSPSFRLSFMRPLGSLSIYLDRLLWSDENVWMMHVVSLAWLALFLIAGAVFFRRFLGPTAAGGMAVLLFALDDAHIGPALWIANRNSLIASVPAVIALLFHDRWRRRGFRPGAVLAVLFFILALLGAELGVGIFGCLVAHALFLDPESPKKSLKSLVPYAGVMVVWRVVYKALGYGVQGSGIYIDPFTSPAAFLAKALERLPANLLALLGPPHAEISLFLPDHLKLYYIAFAVLWIAWAGYVMRPLLKQSAVARFLGAGMLLSLVPSAGTFASDRLLLLSGLGGMGLIGLLVASYLPGAAITRPAGRVYALLASAFIAISLFIHLVIAPLTTPAVVEFTTENMKLAANSAKTLPADGDIEKKTVVIVAAHELFASSFLPVWRSAFGLPVPGHTIVLANSVDPLRVERTGERSLTITAPSGHFNTWTHELIRPRSEPLRAGQEVRYPGARFEVLEANDAGEPLVVRATLERDLDDPSYLWVTWGIKGYVPFTLPPRGQSVTIDIDEAAVMAPQRPLQ
jgi:hypothetical protein